MPRERDWDAEWCRVKCELCSVDCRDGALTHFLAYGHSPVIGGEPVMVGTRTRPVWTFERPYDWQRDGL